MRVVWSILVCLCLVGCMNPKNKAIGVYDTSQLPSDFGGGEAYQIGMNQDGRPVFVNPDAAFKQIVTDYKDGFKAIQKEYYLFPITKLTWRRYGYYGWQLTHEDEEIIDQGYEISRFFEIYKNSF